MIAVRAATLDDVAEILPRTRALNAHEGIVITDELLEAALRRLLGDASLGAVWLIERRDADANANANTNAADAAGARVDRGVIGYAITTFGYDLEFGGRDAYLTELWIDDAQRANGAGRHALELIGDALRARDIRALHLQVRPDNPARRLYERSGFVASPRLVMTRRLV